MQRTTERPEVFDARVDILDAPGQEVAHRPAGRRMVSAELAGGELLDVVKRQPKRLSSGRRFS